RSVANFFSIKEYSEKIKDNLVLLKNLGRTFKALPFRRQSALSAIAPSGSQWKRLSRGVSHIRSNQLCFNF
ncbi:hypothetical protein ABES21_21095, partial [Peribacillus frigoritolerans]|uniref:hypothetical protein n=1 Tax=Peribacillus frigoritolerans TaxID=450367 RepID=UPI003D2A83CC